MTPTLISVVIATSDALALVHDHPAVLCELAYRRESEDVELEFLHGETWRAPSRRAKGEFIHFTYDWLEPHPGWWVAGVAACNAGVVPAPVIWTNNGELAFPDEPSRDWEQNVRSRVPMLSRAQLDYAGPPSEGAFAQLWPAAEDVRCRAAYAFTTTQRA